VSLTLSIHSPVIVYLADKTQFLRDNDHGEIDEIIDEQFRERTGRKVGKAELRSWQSSLGQMAGVLRDDDIPGDTGVAVEYHIPQSSKRIDVTLTGRGPNDEKNAIVIELKQWDKADATEKDAIVVTRVGRGLHELVHPSYQAWSYAALLEGFNTAVYDGHIALQPCAYLHNYRSDGEIDSPAYSAYIEKAPLFLKGESETQRLRDFIKRHIKKGDRSEILYEIENGEIRPSKALADSLAGLLKGNQEFVLIDEQKMVYEASMAAAQSASPAQPKVIIVSGGPGTGKSVVAINLLVALTGKGLVCQYVSKNAAPRAVFQAKLAGTMRRTRFASLFSGSGAFTELPPNEFDVLIVDEAHRLNERSGLYQNLGENQVKELVASAKCTIFFIDEDQRVTLKDIGSKETIASFAAEKGAKVEQYELASQFRCGGSDAYLAWLDTTLDIRPTANTVLSPGEFDFRVFDSPDELHQFIEQKNGNNKARMVAGYCWDWTSKTKPSRYDITIGETYRKRWNLGSDGSLWIIAEESVSEVGCIHTCQGLELDYVGVIVGPDLIVRDGTVLTVPERRSRQDQSLKGYRSFVKRVPERAKREADRVIKNTYRTLMSRGMKGCYVYCTDEETAKYFRSVLAPW
jgi:DUF2075 family protein